MGDYTFMGIIKIFVLLFILLLFTFTSKCLYNSFVHDDYEEVIYQLDKKNRELEHKKIQKEFDLLEKIYK